MCDVIALTVKARLKERGNIKREQRERRRGKREVSARGTSRSRAAQAGSAVVLFLCVRAKSSRDFPITPGANEETETGNLF